MLHLPVVVFWHIGNVPPNDFVESNLLWYRHVLYSSNICEIFGGRNIAIFVVADFSGLQLIEDTVMACCLEAPHQPKVTLTITYLAFHLNISGANVSKPCRLQSISWRLRTSRWWPLSEIPSPPAMGLTPLMLLGFVPSIEATHGGRHN